ncbi:MAG: 3-hydroxyacyl-CoA dehydrogenase family protein [Treponema sp.]|jgi:3-hydroxybutyryl-CoA dehydrogenase|nr:3-hydroxyacyl-CoA dehydrogenase family protein [Treponema sp.]
MSIENILIFGAGMMGKNIAFVFSSKADYRIVVYDIQHIDVHAGIRVNAAPLISKGILDVDKLERRLSRISFTTDIEGEGIKNADLVIEAVFEDMALKQKTFEDLEKHCSRDAVFCTNSSVMSPSEISSKLKHRDRFAGVHFWNPAHLIPLVEVIKSDATSDKTADTLMEVLAGVGKKPVLCKKDIPGFIANRMQHALWREAVYIVEQGIADAKTVDEAVKYSFGLRLPQLGPMENIDMVGLDLTYNIHHYIFKHLCSSTEPSPLLKKLLDNGKNGFKTGEGFQKWTDERQRQSAAVLNEYLVTMLTRK